MAALPLASEAPAASRLAARRSAGYKPALAGFAAFSCAWVFVLVTLGAFTTSINAGMAFPDWPLSNGSLNPHGWLSDLSMFAEHAHRLSAGVMSTLTLVLAIWIFLTEERQWLRRLAWFAFGLVIIQAIVGGLRVLLEPDEIHAWNTSVGQIFAMLHACLAQAFVCTLIAVATACSRSWITSPAPVNDGVRRWGVVCCVLVFIQLGVAAVMRHSFAGLAIPFFPFSNRSHGFLPPAWGFKVAINFTHRVIAGLIAIAFAIYAVRLWRDRAAPAGLKTGVAFLLLLVVLQILLGATIIWSYRDPAFTTAHVLVGAMTLATVFWLTWVCHRDRIQS